MWSLYSTEIVINQVHLMPELMETEIPSNLKPLMVLEFVADHDGDLTLTEIADGLGLPKPTVHRLLHLLERHDFLRQVDGGRSYILGERAQIFAVNVLGSRRAQTSRKQILLWLRDQLNETCTLVIPSDEGMRYVDRAEVDSPLRISFPVGSIVPFHCTASGKLYLSTLSKDEVRHLIEVAGLTQFSVKTITSIDALEAELEVIRGQGFAIDHQEFLAGTIAVGVPVFDFKRRLSLILTVQAPIFRLPLDAVERCLPVLREAANRLELMMQPDAAS
jgi:IclR family acetate operon transcriptional repressor